MSDKTLTKGLKLLEILAISAKPMGVKDLALQAELTQSNVHRLLKTLEELHYVKQSGPRGTYAATPRMFAVGRAVVDRIEIGTVAVPFLQRLHDMSGESASVSIWHDDGPLMIKSVETANRHPLRRFVGAGTPMATTCTSAGLTLLSFQNAVVIARFADSLQPATPMSISTPEALHSRLLDIRKTGRAIVRDEWQFGLSAVSVPVMALGDVVAALTISAASDRMSQEKAESYVGLMAEAARGISSALVGAIATA